MTNPHLKFQSQSVARLYFVGALALFVGQIVFGVTLWASSAQAAKARAAKSGRRERRRRGRTTLRLTPR